MDWDTVKLKNLSKRWDNCNQKPVPRQCPFLDSKKDNKYEGETKSAIPCQSTFALYESESRTHCSADEVSTFAS